MGLTCSCTARNTDDEQWMLEDPEKNHQVNQDQAKGTNMEESSDPYGVEVVDPIPQDPIQLKSYEWEDNKPDETYARPLFLEEEKKIKLNEEVMNTYRKQTVFSIRGVSPNYLRIPPKQPTPFIILENKDIYVGQWANGRTFGIGTLYSKFNGKTYDQIYEGQLEDCNPNGEGTIIYQDGTVYRGLFKMGQIEGQGKLTKVDQFCYNGEWKNNQPHGKGVIINYCMRFIGQFEKWPNKTHYVGDYFEGKKQGKGRFTWVNKDYDNEENKALQEVYDGEFVNNLFEGKGTYEWPDGREYEGTWKRGKMDGNGIFKWSDGKMYEGQYENDLKNGQGVFTFTKDKKLTGVWVDGKVEGLGQLQYKGKTYHGEWRNGVRMRWIRDSQAGMVIPNEMAKNIQKVQKLDIPINKVVVKPGSNILLSIGENKVQPNSIEEDSEQQHQKAVLQILNQQALRQIDESKEKIKEQPEVQLPEVQLDYIDRQRLARKAKEAIAKEAKDAIDAKAKEPEAIDAKAKEPEAIEAKEKEPEAKDLAIQEAGVKAKDVTAKEAAVEAHI